MTKNLQQKLQAAAQRVAVSERITASHDSLWVNSKWWPKESELHSDDDPKKAAFFNMCASLPWGRWGEDNIPSGMDGVYALEQAIDDQIDEYLSLEDIQSKFVAIFNVVKANGQKVEDLFSKFQTYYSKVWANPQKLTPETAIAALRTKKVPELSFAGGSFAIVYTEDGLHGIDPSVRHPNLSSQSRLTDEGLYDFDVKEATYTRVAMRHICEHFGGPMELLLEEHVSVKVSNKPFMITEEGEKSLLEF